MSESLEALDTLVNWGARYEPKSEYYYNLVKKDLEILETLRPHLINAGIGKFDNVEDNEVFHLKLTLSGKEYNKLKEWLEK